MRPRTRGAEARARRSRGMSTQSRSEPHAAGARTRSSVDARACVPRARYKSTAAAAAAAAKRSRNGEPPFCAPVIVRQALERHARRRRVSARRSLPARAAVRRRRERPRTSRRFLGGSRPATRGAAARGPCARSRRHAGAFAAQAPLWSAPRHSEMPRPARGISCGRRAPKHRSRTASQSRARARPRAPWTGSSCPPGNLTACTAPRSWTRPCLRDDRVRRGHALVVVDERPGRRVRVARD